ncbi:thiosulfate oxidation carrier complex protein SoxZ [Methylomonas paludis]|uniref:Thiosulfate oxidation carrier complex protein SoxZ n=1 Tax=Methylomonas paludis TaxID=1173101 RepID=A0A975R822_9GAMM|nr:thiosulfate oxidation carrier complex protein SoxZ [Methylomonas paludis]QWF69905.1 thiosulfate oxidation carrier complex protein SoxZ [Methylomonas paludis]
MSSIKIRSQQAGNMTEIRILLTHPMQNGRNRDPLSGRLIPAHFIEELQLKLNGVALMTVNMAGSIAKNPYFALRLKDLQRGDMLQVSWRDNLNQTDSSEYRLEY